jgi:hypothetical protein
MQFGVFRRAAPVGQEVKEQIVDEDQIVPGIANENVLVRPGVRLQIVGYPLLIPIDKNFSEARL